MADTSCNILLFNSFQKRILSDMMATIATTGGVLSIRTSSRIATGPRLKQTVSLLGYPTAGSRALCAVSSSNEDVTVSMMEALKDDLSHLFDDQGIDPSHYDDVVMFEDPITQYSTVEGYIKNIKFLKNVFSPIFILHDIAQTGTYEITTRWTMTMTPVGLAHRQRLSLPGISSSSSGSTCSIEWNPRLTFTGTSVMGINPETGRFCRHQDTWDAIENQNYFSVEAFLHMLSQVFDVSVVHSLDTDEEEEEDYVCLLKRKEYEIQEYCLDGNEQNRKYRAVFSRGVDVDAICTRDGLKRFLALPNNDMGDAYSSRKGPLVLELGQDFSLKQYVPLIQ